MLRVTRLADRSGRYYLADLAPELAVPSPGVASRCGPVPASHRWVGDGADRLGLRGCVTPGALEALLEGRNPSGAHRLRARDTTVSGYDLTFAAPKSVSVLFALADRDTAAAVRTAHDDAVDAATDYVARHAAGVRVVEARERRTSAVDGLVGAAFTHGVSRALDPHLHTHVVVPNLGRGDDGRWRALDGRGLYAHALAAGDLYDAVLRHGVSARAGLAWVPGATRRWELLGVEPAVIGAFSGRRAEILAHAALHAARPAARARTVAWAATREPKVAERSADALRERWAAAARDAGWCADLVSGVARQPARNDVDEHRFASVIAEAGARGVARRDALSAWAASLGTGTPASDVERCVDQLADWGTGVGVAERPCRPAGLVPPSHVRHALGARPASPDDLALWQSAASSIARYRARWGVHDAVRALGDETPAARRAMSARRLADHLATTRTVSEALRTLGRERTRHDRDRELGLGLAPDR